MSGAAVIFTTACLCIEGSDEEVKKFTRLKRGRTAKAVTYSDLSSENDSAPHPRDQAEPSTSANVVIDEQQPAQIVVAKVSKPVSQKKDRPDNATNEVRVVVGTPVAAPVATKSLRDVTSTSLPAALAEAVQAKLRLVFTDADQGDITETVMHEFAAQSYGIMARSGQGVVTTPLEDGIMIPRRTLATTEYITGQDILPSKRQIWGRIRSKASHSCPIHDRLTNGHTQKTTAPIHHKTRRGNGRRLARISSTRTI